MIYSLVCQYIPSYLQAQLVSVREEQYKITQYRSTEKPFVMDKTFYDCIKY